MSHNAGSGSRYPARREPRACNREPGHKLPALAAASGAPLKALMQRMGHSTVAAALRYQHVVDGQQDAIADYLDGVAPASFSDRGRPAEPDACGTFVARTSAGEGAETGDNTVTKGNDGWWG